MVTGSVAVGPGLGLGTELVSRVPGAPFRKLWNVTVWVAAGSPVADSWLPRLAGPGLGARKPSSPAVIISVRSPAKPALLIEVSLVVNSAGWTAPPLFDVEKLIWTLKSPRGPELTILPRF